MVVFLHFTSESLSELNSLWNLKIGLLLHYHALWTVSIYAAIRTAQNSKLLCSYFQWRGWARKIQRSCSEKFHKMGSHRMFALMTLVHLPSAPYVCPTCELFELHSFWVFLYYRMVKHLCLLGWARDQANLSCHNTHNLHGPLPNIMGTGSAIRCHQGLGWQIQGFSKTSCSAGTFWSLLQVYDHHWKSMSKMWSRKWPNLPPNTLMHWLCLC